MENRSHALLAGIFTVCSILAAAVALWWFSGARETTQTYLLETRDNLIGLNVEAQVRYRGIRAGKVRKIYPDPLDPGLLLVEISLGQQYRLTDRTRARLNYQGITGLAYVMLDEDHQAAGTAMPLAVDGHTLPRIAIQRGLIATLGDKAGDIVGEVGELTQRLNQLLDENNVRNVARTLDNLAVASDGLRELPRIVAGLRAVLSEANLARFQSLLAHLEKTAAETAPLAVEARELLGTLHGLAQSLDKLAATADGVGARFEQDTLPRAEALLVEAAAATRRLEQLLRVLERTPQSTIFGKPANSPGPGEAGHVPASSLGRTP